jgi:predicted nucleic acid-binding protein
VAQLIDTSVFVALERQKRGLDELVSLLPQEPVTLASITASELLVGVYYADTDERRQRRRAFVERILDELPVISFDLAAARTYARLFVELRKSGQTVGAHDLQVAATAISRGFEVATHNLRDFGRVPGLVVRQIELFP